MKEIGKDQKEDHPKESQKNCYDKKEVTGQKYVYSILSHRPSLKAIFKQVIKVALLHILWH